MAIRMLHDLVGPNWILKAGEIYEFDPLRESNWISAGYCVEHQPAQAEELNVKVNATLNGVEIDTET